MGACTECRAAKVKCDQIIPCSRCKRLSRVCVQHESKQGQRNSSKRKRNHDVDASEDAVLSGELLACPSVQSDHFGLQYLVRSWVSMALRRRSFSLLSRAGTLAVRCGISMDQILCETETQRGMDFLYPILLTETSKQKVVDSDGVKLDNVPESLWKAIDCNYEDPSLERRWILIREMKKGLSGYYCSPAFEENIMTRSSIEETYRSNQKPIVDLFLPDRSTHTRGIAHQISLYKTPGVAPKPCRLSGVKLQTLKSVYPVDVDQIICLVIINIDHAIYSVEYVPKGKADSSAESKVTTSYSEAPEWDLDSLALMDLDELEGDKDLEFIYDLLLH